MGDILTPEIRAEALARGYSRRQFGRIAGVLSMSSAFARFVSAAHASGPSEAGRISEPVRIGANECWIGPFPETQESALAAFAHGHRYEPSNLRATLIATVAEQERIPVEYVRPWQGSMDPLMRAIVTFCAPQRGLVTVDPTFEAAWRTAQWLGVRQSRVPLLPHNEYATDVRALLKADPNAGLYYVCTPNNPTGTITPLEDIVWLADNKPKDAVILVDEAYIHFSRAESAISLVTHRKDIVVLRTFSKLFGMAGLRLGLSFAHPDLHRRMLRYDGEAASQLINVVALATGNASLRLHTQIEQRRSELIANREYTLGQLKRRNIHYLPGSEANMIMVDWGKNAASLQKAIAGQGVEIGRSWPIWPNRSRVTIGSRRDMERFIQAIDVVTG